MNKCIVKKYILHKDHLVGNLWNGLTLMSTDMSSKYMYYGVFSFPP